MDNLKKGLSEQSTITQKKPKKVNETNQTPVAETEKVANEGKKGNFRFKY